MWQLSNLKRHIGFLTCLFTFIVCRVQVSPISCAKFGFDSTVHYLKKNPRCATGLLIRCVRLPFVISILFLYCMDLCGYCCLILYLLEPLVNKKTVTTLKIWCLDLIQHCRYQHELWGEAKQNDFSRMKKYSTHMNLGFIIFPLINIIYIYI